MKMYKHPYYTSFNDQRQHAKRRGIDWHFDFNTWLEWWGDDIVNRGRNKGQLVMARIGDVGSYEPSNVRKATSSENVSESRLGKPSHRKGKECSLEHKINNSLAQKAYHAKQKELKEIEICL